TLAKDAVTSPLRAPFTRYAGTGGPAEVMEEVRGGSLRHALGEMLSCPFCLDLWVATGFALGLVSAPRASRLIGATFGALAGADLLQLAYSTTQQQQQQACGATSREPQATHAATAGHWPALPGPRARSPPAAQSCSHHHRLQNGYSRARHLVSSGSRHGAGHARRAP
ncbi:MAG: DUF1360 domain-containing protein, partial [Pseudonocardia sp.]|nr:DUF1360 domain-containing protein [Pseudonocardia sp.]